MPYLSTSQEWFHQSSLLLQARPTTTRITTKYTISSPTPSTKSRKRKAPSTDPTSSTTASNNPPSAPPPPTGPTATLTLKTYDPASGVCLKYQTTKAAEVGRLIASLGKLGRGMAALPEGAEDVAMVDAPAAAGELGEPVSDGTAKEGKEAKAGAQETKAGAAETKSAQGGGGGGKRKKKGKK